MKRPWILATVLSGMSLPAHGLQAKTPEAALEEIATADKPEVIVRHLPEPVQKSIDGLPKPRKQEVLEKLLSMKSEHLDGCTIRRASDAEGWEIIGQNGESAGKVKLANVFISGLDALVSLQFQSEESSQMFMVAMHLEGDDWRIDDFGPWQKTNLRLHQLVHQPSDSEKNEAATVETLHKMVTALYSYAAQYPRIGFPSALDVLAGKAGQETSAEHAGLLEEPFAADPLIMNGFQFRYTLTRMGGPVGFTQDGQAYALADRGAFQIVATPVEFGRTGTRNYLAFWNGRINWTAENRPATEDDPLIGGGDDED